MYLITSRFNFKTQENMKNLESAFT